MSNAGSQHALVLAPHPDDEALGCGGTIKLISSAGGHVDLLYLTRGERGFESGTPITRANQEALAAIRSAEAMEACRVLGVERVDFAGGHDGSLRADGELSSELLRTLRQNGYRSVFAPWPCDHHADHRAAYEILLAALRDYSRPLQVWLYEVWSPLEPNLCVPIDSVIEWKTRAIRAHVSQLATMDYVTAFHALAQYRSLFCPPGKYAEAFFTCDRESLCRDPGLPCPRCGASRSE